MTTPLLPETPIDRSGFHLHLVSDATGETIQSVVRACLVQFDVEPIEHFWNMVRSHRQLDLVIEEIERHGGIVYYTLVDDRLRLRLEDACTKAGIRCISILDPIMMSLAEKLGMPGKRRPGRQHSLDSAYFHRIEAMDFAIAQDDGNGARSLHQADVVLVGVSRTSKTPTCLYLANRGIRAANVPFVPGVPLPRELLELSNAMIVGLTKDPDQLVQLRRNRLKTLHQGQSTDYVDPEKVREEVTEARRLYARMGWPVIDVTRRAIEETAAEITRLLARRRQSEAQGDTASNEARREARLAADIAQEGAGTPA
ncbi:MAG: pyruvate, water dikinase regulatory protein [Azospirillaceae bacterium]